MITFYTDDKKYRTMNEAPLAAQAALKALALTKEGGMRQYDIVIVFGPQGCGKTHNMYRIAEHYGMNVIRDECAGEWPCPLSLRETQRVLYLCQPQALDYEFIERAIVEGYSMLIIPFDKLSAEVLDKGSA